MTPDHIITAVSATFFVGLILLLPILYCLRDL